MAVSCNQRKATASVIADVEGRQPVLAFNCQEALNLLPAPENSLGILPSFGRILPVLPPYLIAGGYIFGSRPGFVFRHQLGDRKSTRLNSSHRCISYAVFC